MSKRTKAREPVIAPIIYTRPRWIECDHKQSSREKLIKELPASRKISSNNLLYADDTIMFGQIKVEHTIMF